MSNFTIELITNSINNFFSSVGNYGSKILFFNICPFFGDKIDIPFLIFWLSFASVYFFIRMRLYNCKIILLSIKYFASKKIEDYQKEQIKKNGYGSTSKATSLFATGSNVDLGTIFGVAAAMQIGGIGVLFWMFVAAILSISIRVIEVFISHFYRINRKTEKIFQGGPQYYIEMAFKKKGVKWIGKSLKIFFILSISFSTFFSPQINQTVKVINYFVNPQARYNWLISLIISVLVIILLIGGFDRVAKYLRKTIPMIGMLYLSTCIIIIAIHHNNILPTIKNIYLEGLSLKNGISSLLFIVSIGARRAFFCLETGMGSSGITHANSVNNSSLGEAILGAIVPLISVVIVALCSGMVVGVTHPHLIDQNKTGIEILVQSFKSVHANMHYVLFLTIPLFGISTSIAWSYYGKNAWISLFGKKSDKIYIILLFIAYWSCGQSDNFISILNAADVINLSTTIPNIIALYILSNRYLKTFSNKFKKPIKDLDKEIYESFFMTEEENKKIVK